MEVMIIAGSDHFSDDIIDNHNSILDSTMDDKSNEYTIVMKTLISIME